MALYSRKDLTREKYAVSLSFSGQPFRLRLRKDNLEFALDVIIIIIYLYSLKTWHEYYKQCYTKNLHTMMSF